MRPVDLHDQIRRHALVLELLEQPVDARLLAAFLRCLQLGAEPDETRRDVDLDRKVRRGIGDAHLAAQTAFGEDLLRDALGPSVRISALTERHARLDFHTELGSQPQALLAQIAIPRRRKVMHILRDRRQIRFTRGAYHIVPVLAELRWLDDLRRRIGHVLDPLAQQPALVLVPDIATARSIIDRCRHQSRGDAEANLSGGYSARDEHRHGARESSGIVRCRTAERS